VALGQMATGRHPALQHALVLERQGVSLLPEASYALSSSDRRGGSLIRMARDEDPRT